jgi:hypothetical protein
VSIALVRKARIMQGMTAMPVAEPILPEPPIRWRRGLPIVAGVLLVLGLLYSFSGLPGAPLGTFAGLLCGLWLCLWYIRARLTISGRLAASLGAGRQWTVNVKSYPLYKAVDLYHAARSLAQECSSSSMLASSHSAVLSALLASPLGAGNEPINVATRLARKVSYDQDALFPQDCFWLIGQGSGPLAGPAIIRSRFVGPAGTASFFMLEVAAPTPAAAAAIAAAVGERASIDSIYRNRTVRVVFGAQVRSHYGDEDGDAPMDITFVAETPIADDEIVLEDEIREVIEATVIDFHERRQELMKLGLPGKRGVLFYGPPGTGKTYTCKYIGQRLQTATKIVVTGHSLLHMKHICAIARMLQPALVLLEDVDLVFMERERNPASTVLGEFIDQLDGFGEADEVIFIMTTNAIERVESAIKDRPGRVSQCLFFGAPGSDLRKRYLARLLRPYNASQVDLDRVVGETDGVSQAFLKELVARAVQLASRELRNGTHPTVLSTRHLLIALRQMVEGSGRAAQRIIGFRVDAS